MIKFKGKPTIKIFDNEKNYKMYGFEVCKELYPQVKLTKYGNATICGDIPELEEEFTYEVTAEEQHSDRYGYRYAVIKISPIQNLTETSIISFLSQILTPNQAYTLYSVYPDIIDKIINDEEVDLSKLKGIKEKTFDKIKNKIILNYKLLEYVNLFGGALSLSKLQELYNQYTSIQKIEEELYKDPYSFLTKLGGIAFKKADLILCRLDKEGKLKFNYELKPSVQRCKAAVDFILKENEDQEGNTKMELRACYEELKKLAPECINQFKIALDDKRFYVDLKNMIIARQKTYDDEYYICSTILKGMKVQSKKYDIDIEKYRKTDDFELSDEQMDFLRMALNNNICILTAPGGTGKSAATGVLVKMLSEANISCLLMTPTGKSAKVLKEYANYPASTIHKALGYNPKLGWSDDPIKQDVVIVDEFSMCSIYLMKQILKVIDFSKTKLIMIGDNEQLPPINAGNLLHDFIFSKKIPTARLTKVFRYGSNGLLTVATDIRTGQEFLPKDKDLVIYGDNQDYIFQRCPDNKIIDKALNIYEKLITTGWHGKIYKPEEIAILSAYNKGEYGANIINKRIQQLLHNNNDKHVVYGDNLYYIDDIIMQIHNDYKCLKYINDTRTTEEDGTYLVTNGETGVIEAINQYNELGVNFGVDSLIKRTRENQLQMQLGYSYSLHKSQGASIKVVILITPKAHIYFLNSNLIYVGVTRTTDVCFHLGLQSTVNYALKQKENFNRSTFTQELLRVLNVDSIE